MLVGVTRSNQSALYRPEHGESWHCGRNLEETTETTVLLGASITAGLLLAPRIITQKARFSRKSGEDASPGSEVVPRAAGSYLKFPLKEKQKKKVLAHLLLLTIAPGCN